MQIVCVKTKDFKGIKLVEVVPGRGTTVIGGKNRAGKSSLLDSIAATLGGLKLCPKSPIRDGQDTAKCSVTLTGDEALKLPQCTVKRTWKRNKDGKVVSSLEITTEAGHKVPSPQAALDKIVGQLGFDPERFLRMNPREQAEVLRSLVGLDFADLDQQRQKAYDERTEVNRRGKQLRAQFDAMPHHEDAPAEEVSVSDLMEKLAKANKINSDRQESQRKADEDHRKAEDQKRIVERRKESVGDLKIQITKLEEALHNADSGLADAEAEHKSRLDYALDMKSKANTMPTADTEPIQQAIAESETVNRKLRENIERDKLAAELESERKRSEDMTKKIESVDAKKQEMRESATWPVDGLGYGDLGVTLMDRPFEQASATEQREAAFAIVAGLNPSLKFAMIKDGSLLDDESLADFARIASDRGFQLFVERVGDGAECSLVISEGLTDD